MASRTLTKRVSRELLATCWTWAGNAAPARGNETSPIPIADRIRAAADAGWQGVGFVHADLVEIRESIGLRALKRMLDNHGIGTVELEFISNWWAQGDLRSDSDRVRSDLFGAAEALGARTIKVGAELQSFKGEGPVDMAVFYEEFDALATDAGSRGLRVALEPMPMSNVRTVAEGAAMVKEIGNPHGGLVIDTWHVARSGTAYADLPLLLPIEHVFVVELDDASANVSGTLWEDTINRRRLPGDGDLRTSDFVAAMIRAGWTGHWGVEIISEEHRRKALPDALAETRTKALSAIETAAEAVSK